MVLVSSVLIIFMCLESFKEIVSFIKSISDLNIYNIDFIKILLKITGISIILEYAITICRDCGENSIASKIDLGGKVILVSMSIPIISNTVQILTSLIN